MRLRAATCCLFLLVLAGCEQGSGCDLVKVAQVPLEPKGRVFAIPVTVNGHAITMELDTGATRSFLFETTVNRLDMVRDARTSTIMAGAVGWSLRADVSIDSMSIAGAPLSPGRLAVNTYGRNPAFDGLFGLDMLRDFDLDIDEPNRLLALYRVRRCEHADPPWNEPATPIAGISTRNGWLEAPFEIDGVAESAMVDTGASATVITPRLARRLGLTEQDLAKDRTLVQHTVASEDSQVRVHRFHTVRVGPITVHDAAIVVLAKEPPLLGGGRRFVEAAIGHDFLSRRRIWFSFATDRLYMSGTADNTAATGHATIQGGGTVH